MVSRREFFDRSGRLALSLGVLRATERLGPLATAGPTGAGLEATAAIRARDFVLENASISATWTLTEDSLRPAKLIDRVHGVDLPVSAELFTLTLGAGPAATTLAASEFRIVGDPKVEPLAANASASRRAEQVPGRSVAVTLRDPDARLEVVWRGVLRDGSGYVRQELSVRALAGDVPLREVSLFDFTAARTWVSGTVRGTPIVVGDAYYAFEHPLANNGVDGDRVRCRMPRTLPLRRGATLEVSSVVGVTRSGQLRRDFLAYVERERAHPYRTFLHYNSWYDIGYFSKFSEAGCARRDRTRSAPSCSRQRGVTLDSFLFDDGWDDPHDALAVSTRVSPMASRRARRRRAKYGAAPGVWMSPWGGYGKPQEDRARVRQAAGLRDERGRLRALGAQVLPALSRDLLST